MDAAFVVDWLNLLLRWAHMIVGIAWIGASVYFIWLDNHLHKPLDPADAAKGMAGHARNLEPARTVGDHKRPRLAGRAGRDRRARAGHGRHSHVAALPPLGKRHAAQQDSQALGRQPEPAAGDSPLARAEPGEIETVGNHPHLMPAGIEDARAGEFVGQPAARRDKPQRDARQATPGAGEAAGGEFVERGHKLRAGDAAGGESAAAG